MVFDYTGVIHCHSNYSYDSNVPVSEIIEAGNNNGIDFIMLTDHFRMDAKLPYEGWHNNLLVIVGEEISPRYNHYLAFDISKRIIVKREGTPPQNYIDEVNREGGFGIIAHPDHQGTMLFGVKPYPWIDWNVAGYTGYSIWDMMSDWQEKLVNYPRAVFAYIFPCLVLTGPKQVTLDRWDELNMKSKVVGIGEIDNHDKRFTLLTYCNFYIFNYNFAFKTIRTHVLTKQPLIRDTQEDIKNIFDSLKKGRVYVALEYWNKANGFQFNVFDNKKTSSIGESFLLEGDALLEVKLPLKGFIRVIKDGRALTEMSKDGIQIDVKERGVYRVEAYQKILSFKKPWIFSNPIYVV